MRNREGFAASVFCVIVMLAYMALVITFICKVL
jgi:hypothetical protein